jgi:hypothetical protein
MLTRWAAPRDVGQNSVGILLEREMAKRNDACAFSISPA